MPRRKTQEEFVKEVYDLVGNEYTVMSEYKNKRTKITMRHSLCGNAYEILTESFLKGKRCKECLMNQKDIKFKKEVYDLVGDEYSVLEKYSTCETKIKLRHNECNHEYSATPTKFFTGRRCPKCAGRHRRTHEEFVKEVYDLAGNEYEVIGEFIDTTTKINIKHNKCGSIYPATPKVFLRGNRCPICFGSPRKTQEEFEEEISDLVGNEYKVIGNYENTHTKIEIKHNECSLSYTVTPRNFFNGHRCPKCFGTPKKTVEQLKKEIYDLVGDEYEVIGEYFNTNTKIEIKHNECGNAYMVIPYTFLSGRRCPKCIESRGEKKIDEFFRDNRVNFSSQFRFKNCRNTAPLPFDFAVIEGGNVKVLVEYDGEGHFKPFRYSKDEEIMLKKLKNAQKNDQIKNAYCIDNKIPLIRIPYWEYENVDEILHQVLGYFNIINKRGDICEAWVHRYLVNDSEWSHEKYLSEVPSNETRDTNIPIRKALENLK
ncbi:hypothetical protein M3611_20940 [Priestia megaterium]|uniref:hypothetical protein n=1 Tax=Priestia megaterium TaxID=1404 RepID=UPI00203B86F4|nr:hypothetical protein [Priestia megaterium]MCM3154479.1 hypothetical protein [Priestia megaterium]